MAEGTSRGAGYSDSVSPDIFKKGTHHSAHGIILTTAGACHHLVGSQELWWAELRTDHWGGAKACNRSLAMNHS